MLHALFFWPFFFWGPFHGFGSLLLLIVILALIFGRRRYYWWHPYDHPANWGGSTSRAQALAILEQRYARGEIQRDEYLQKRQDLGG